MNLDDLRQEIDRIDDEIVRLLNERAQNAVRIGEEKSRQGTPVHDPEREDEVLRRVKAVNSGPLDSAAMQAVYRQIISACSNLQDETHSQTTE